MSTDTKIKTLIFNKLTQEQYNNADRVPTEFYLTPDDTDEKLATKQDKLIAGTNITIEGNVINATGGSATAGRPLGEVYFSQSSLAADNPGALPGWTGEYYENGKTLFPDLYNFVKAHSELQVTKTEYDSAIATYGECPKYVVDENTAQTSLRLPKYKNTARYLIKKEVNGNNWYALYSDGWLEQGGYFANPQTIGTGAITETFLKSYATAPTVLFGNMSHRKNASYDSENHPYDVTANGFTHENVQPEGQGTRWYAFGYAADTPMENIMYPWISAYTSAIPASTAQAAEFTGALSGKANTDLSNVLSTIDYVVEAQVLSDGSWYRKYKSGWIEQGGVATSDNVTLLKPMANANYSVYMSQSYNAGGYSAYSAQPHNRTTTSFSYFQFQGYFNAFWYVCGKGAN